MRSISANSSRLKYSVQISSNLVHAYFSLKVTNIMKRPVYVGTLEGHEHDHSKTEMSEAVAVVREKRNAANRWAKKKSLAKKKIWPGKRRRGRGWSRGRGWGRGRGRGRKIKIPIKGVLSKVNGLLGQQKKKPGL